MQLALAKQSTARKTFRLAIDQAQRAGYREYFFEARLALLKSEPISLRQKTELQTLARLADQSGFRLVAANSQKGS